MTFSSGPFAFTVFDSDLWVCWTLSLLHFLWLGCVIALVAALLGWLLRGASSQARYVVNLSALLVMAASLPVTMAVVQSPRMDAPLAVMGTPSTLMADSPDEIAQVESQIPRELPTLAAENDNRELAVPHEQPASQHLAATPAPVVKLPRPVSLLESAAPFVAAAYLVGVLIMLGRLTLALYGARRLRLAARPVQDDQLLALLARQAKRLGLAVVPAIGWCERIAVPVVVGLARPMVLLPAALATGLEGSQLEALLAHELAHLRRLDLLVNLVQRLIETVLFFHPAVWYVSRQVSIERENACDDLVLSTGWPRVQYADALVRLAELCAGPTGLGNAGHAALLAASGESPSQFKRRVLRLIGQEPPPALPLNRSGLIALALAVSLLVAAPVVLRTRAGAKPVDPAANEELIATVGPPQDAWPQFGGSPLRNHATDADLPISFDLAAKNTLIAVANPPDGKALPNKGAAARAKPSEGEWGPAVHGVQARLVLTEEPTEFRAGEVLSCDLSLRNTTAKPVAIWLRNPLEWQWSVKGNEIQLHCGDKAVVRGDWHNSFELQPGETRLVPRKKPRALIQPAGWKGETKDYNLPILSLVPAEYQVTATDVHVLKRTGNSDSEPMPLATGVVSIKVIGKDDARPPVPARITENLAKISWGEPVEGLQAGIAWASDDELNDGDSCELFIRNAGKRELTFGYIAPPLDSWFVYGTDKAGKPLPRQERLAIGWLAAGNTTLKPGEFKRVATPHIHNRNSRPGTFPEDAGIVGRIGSAGFPDAEGGYRYELQLKTGTLDLRARPTLIARLDDGPPRREEARPEVDTAPPQEVRQPKPDAAAETSKDEIAWGETTAGLQFGLKFPGGKNRFRVGQTMAFAIHARNRTDKPINLRYGWPSSWFAERSGERISVSPMFLGGQQFMHRVTLKPGEERELPDYEQRPTQEVLLAPRDWKEVGEPFVTLEPGTKAALTSPAVLLIEPEVDADWRGKAATGALPFEVLEAGGSLRQVDVAEWGKPIAWPAEAWRAAPLPKTWDKAELWKRLTSHLLSRTERELKPHSFEERDGRLKIEYRTRRQHVWRPAGKAGGGQVRRIDTGPRADGLLLEMWFSDESEQAVRPQTLESDPWRTYLGQVPLPELKTSLLVNVSYGPLTDPKQLLGFVSPRDWLVALDESAAKPNH